VLGDPLINRQGGREVSITTIEKTEKTGRKEGWLRKRKGLEGNQSVS
jgi:hypothetical protein